MFLGISWLILPQEFALPIAFLGIDYRPWRLLVVACAIPYATAALIMYFAPESPKFLYADGQHEACLKVVKKIYAVNKRTSEDNFPVSLFFCFGTWLPDISSLTSNSGYDNVDNLLMYSIFMFWHSLAFMISHMFLLWLNNISAK